MIEFHRTGRLRILAGTSPKRLTAANDLPTAAESLPAMISQQLICSHRYGEGDHQSDRASKPYLARRVRLSNDAGRDRILSRAVDSSPEIFRGRIEAEIAKWTPIVQELGIKIV